MLHDIKLHKVFRGKMILNAFLSSGYGESLSFYYINVVNDNVIYPKVHWQQYHKNVRFLENI
jgi:hypothetical protein